MRSKEIEGDRRRPTTNITIFPLWAIILSMVATAHPATAQQASRDLQEKCSKQAQIFFDRSLKKKQMASFINHYNVKLNRCFIQTEQYVPQQNGAMIYKAVTDAYEGKDFASYIWRSDKEKKYWEVAPIECKVTLPSGDEKICASSDEFDELVKTYMQ
jgi:hypothetical protein